MGFSPGLSPHLVQQRPESCALFQEAYIPRRLNSMPLKNLEKPSFKVQATAKFLPPKYSSTESDAESRTHGMDGQVPSSSIS